VLMGIERFLRDTMQDGKHVVIAVDEAQLINDESVFEELRLLLNYQTETKFLLTLILCGQPELREKLDSNKQFSQRIALSYRLQPLDFEETRKYVLHRLMVAGLEENIFDEKALELLFERSGGIPRWINNIANMSMLAAFSKGVKLISPELVAEGVDSAK
jgi:general secretion pathway protein A